MKPHNQFPKPIKSSERKAVPCAIRALPFKHAQAVRSEQDTPLTNHFELIWVTQGGGNQLIDLQQVPVNSDKLFCLRPGQVHRFESCTELGGYAIQFDADFVRSIEREVNSVPLVDLLQLFSSAQGIAIPSEAKSHLIDLISQMQKVLNSQDLLKTELLKCYVEIFVIYVNHVWDGQVETCTKTRNMEMVESFNDLLEKHFREIRMVSEYASLLAVTPNYLNEVIKKITGSSAGHLIRQRVGLEAKRKALHTGMCMKEVAYSLGFSDQAHFSKFFKSTTGKNFSDFRKERLTLSFAGINS